MKTFLSLLLAIILVASWSSLAAQESRFNINGTVVDSSGMEMAGATVVLLNAADSVLVKFTLSSSGGQFSFKKIKTGEYLLQVTYIGYQQVSMPISLTADMQLDPVEMLPEALNLGEVSIEADRTPILIKGDTIEYNADAFGTQPNAVVEDLLKKLPGVEVESDGTVKAQGETVNKVLVDGKEFFGNDPQIATKNLPADAVDKVQVFDKKSEFAEFTGIDDGQEQKAINLELKEDKKQGVFGRVSAGYGTQNRFESKANVNRFTDKMQLSVLGMGNNINRQGFSFNDYLNFMGGIQGLMGGGGGSGRISIELDPSSTGLPIAQGLSNGLVTTLAGGANLNYDIGKKTELNVSYMASHIGNEILNETDRTNFIGKESFESSLIDTLNNQNTMQALNFTLRHKIDSMQNIIIRGRATQRNGNSFSSRLAETFGDDGFLQNESDRSYESLGKGLDLSSSLMYRRRFRKPGRAFVANAGISQNVNDKTGILAAENAFYYQNGQETLIVDQNQRQVQMGDELQYEGRISYTEPLGKKTYLEFNAAHQNYGENALQEVRDLDQSEALIPELSNEYRRDYLYSQGGLNLMHNRKKLNFTVGGDVQYSILKGEIFSTGATINNDFLFFLPHMHTRYEFATTKSISLDYTTSIQEPAMDQLQPLVNNTDPLNIYIGNPDLVPEYSHQANLHLMLYDQFTFTSFFVNIMGRYTQNKITSARTIDSLLRQTTQPINVSQDLMLNGFLNFGTPLKFMRSRINIDGQGMYNRGIVYVNQVENLTDFMMGAVKVSVENRKKEKLDISVGARLSYNLTQYSVSEELNQQFANQSYFTDITVNIGKKWSVQTDFKYNIYGGAAFEEQQVVPLWRASVSRYVLKRRGQFTFTAFDLLNQNRGVSRNSAFNYVEETRSNALGRFFMLSFTYNLSKLGLDQEGGGGMKIMINE